MNFVVNEPLQATLSDVEEFLAIQRIPHALVGGLAVSLRGQPRVTVDVDMVMAIDVEEALAIERQLEASNFRPLFDDVATVIETAFILPLRHRSTGVKVDLAIELSGFERQLVERAEKCLVAGAEIPVATAEDLLIMKCLAGRPRDEQDLEGLVIAQNATLDWGYCDRMATQLGEALGQDLVGRVRKLRDGASRTA